MSGRPVWLASISQWKNGRNIPTPRWGDGVVRQALKVSQDVLGDLGDSSMERGFLMDMTLCVHRAASDAEIDALPEGPGGLAGPPFDKVIYETAACPAAGLSFQSCDSPEMRTLPNTKVRMKVHNCGTCPSCVARDEIYAATQ